MGNVQRLFEPLTQWQRERVPARSEGYSLELDEEIANQFEMNIGTRRGRAKSQE